VGDTGYFEGGKDGIKKESGISPLKGKGLKLSQRVIPRVLFTLGNLRCLSSLLTPFAFIFVSTTIKTFLTFLVFTEQ
jgi:hypothetical protein